MATVFITGCCVLVVEIVATRILSPYFGNTIFTVSSVITVILAALSFGYYFGGKIADRMPKLSWFYGIILISGISVFILQAQIAYLLPFFEARWSIISGPLISSMLLFFLPAFFMGTLSPYAIKLLQQYAVVEGIGSISGEVFFWSTLGSISGSLSSGFVLIPRFGIDTIVISVGVVLSSLGIFGLVLSRKNLDHWKKALVIVLCEIAAGSLFMLVQGVQANVVFSADGLYQKIRIVDVADQDKTARFLLLDKSRSGAKYLNSNEHVFEFSKYYELYKLFRPQPRDILVIGGGSYTIPQAYLQDIPDAQIDVVEIEPMLYDLALKYFNVSEDPRMKNYVADGRRFLKETNKQYDIIFADAFHSLFSVPPHLTTKEFFELTRTKLKPQGLFLANFIGDLEKNPHSLIYSEMKTFNSVYPQTYFYATHSPNSTDVQNIIFVGINGSISENIQETDSIPQGLIFQTLSEKEIRQQDIDFSPYPVFTDNYSPVEFFSARNLR